MPPSFPSAPLAAPDRVPPDRPSDAAGDGDRLAATVAHEVNNLLMVVIGNLDLLEPELPDSESARECVREMRAAVDRGTALTRRVLTLAPRPDGH